MLNSSEPRTCTVERQDHQFCGRPSIPDAPFPICRQYVLAAYRHVAGQLDEAIEDPRIMFAVGADEMDARRAKRVADRLPVEETAPVVYYLLVNGLVKIGFASNLNRRLTGYPPNAHLLGTEPGGRDLERTRLAQFHEYLNMKREWFTPGPRLREHIELLQDYQAA